MVFVAHNFSLAQEANFREIFRLVAAISAHGLIDEILAFA